MESTNNQYQRLNVVLFLIMLIVSETIGNVMVVLGMLVIDVFLIIVKKIR